LLLIAWPKKTEGGAFLFADSVLNRKHAGILRELPVFNTRYCDNGGEAGLDSRPSVGAETSHTLDTLRFLEDH
jgi:hypothetical protein